LDDPKICLLGDRALLVTLSQEISEATNEIVLSACDLIESAQIPGVEEAQPAYSSFCIHFNPSKVSAAWLGAYAKGIIHRLRKAGVTGGEGVYGRETHPDSGVTAAAVKRRLVEIPVQYGGEEGPDLAWASEHLKMQPEEIVRRHAGSRYRVYMIGFSPGFPYLGGLDQSIAMPRTPTPRTSVPPGSVGIGGGQTGIYPWQSPGGWRIIGRTPLKLFDPARKDPSLLHPGDTVRFVPVGRPPDLWDGHPTPADKSEGHAKSARPGVPAFLVEHPGLLSLVVDDGRRGYRKLGVPLGGAADANSYALANRLCGNKPSDPALEMTLWGVRMRVLVDAVVAVTGAPCPVDLDGKPVSMNEPVQVREGSVLEVGSPTSGCRMYLAVSGGFGVPRVLGSATTCFRGSFGGYGGRSLLRGDVLEIGPGAWPEGHPCTVPDEAAGWPGRLSRFLDSDPPSLRVIPGPESTSPAGRSFMDSLCDRVFGVSSDTDRMGIRLEGSIPQEDGEAGDILSSPVVPGVIQLPSDGRPVLLLQDAQTSGGYRRIATVMDEDLPLAGQLRPGSRVRFTRRG
jgi:KipI family sensor histidine kinase inhibitor